MIKNKFTLKQLEAFVCVVDVGSFRKAAEVLATTQPNISNRIATLEHSLGVGLMNRDAGSVRLTDKGEALLVSARQVLWAAEALIEAADRRELITDRMRLGVTELIACTWLHRFLRRFRERYPSVSIELDVDLSVEIEKQLAAGRCDLALLAGPARTSDPVRNTRKNVDVGIYPYVWVASAGVAKSLAGKQSVADLMPMSLLLHSRHTSAVRELFAYCEMLRLPTERIVCSSSLTSCVQMAIDQMGVALVPRAIVQSDLSAGRLTEVPADWNPPPLQFQARFDAARAPKFVQFAAELAAEVSREMQNKLS